MLKKSIFLILFINTFSFATCIEGEELKVDRYYTTVVYKSGTSESHCNSNRETYTSNSKYAVGSCSYSSADGYWKFRLSYSTVYTSCHPIDDGHVEPEPPSYVNPDTNETCTVGLDGRYTCSCSSNQDYRYGVCTDLGEGTTGFDPDGIPLCGEGFELGTVEGEQFCLPVSQPQITCPAGTVQTGTDLFGNPICHIDYSSDGNPDTNTMPIDPTIVDSIVVNADGSVTTTNLDGSSRTDYSDGTYVSYYPDGTINQDTRTPAQGGTGTSTGGGGDTSNPDDGTGTGTTDRPCELDYYVSDCGDGAPSLKCTDTTFTCDRGCDEVNYTSGDNGCVKGFECPIGTIETGTDLTGSPICHEDCDLDGIADIYDDDTSLCDTTNPDPIPPQEVEQPINDNSNLESSLDSLNSTATSINNNTQSIDSKLDTTNQTLEDIKNSLNTADEEKLNDLNTKFDKINTDFTTLFSDMESSFNQLETQVNDYKQIFEGGLEFTPISYSKNPNLEECLSLDIFGSKVSFDFVTPMSTLKPIVVLFFQIILMIALWQISVQVISLANRLF